MITTKNRCLDLQRTCEILKKLSPPPLEILITADGCTDDTVKVVRSVLPLAHLIINEEGRGSVASRDRMMREAKGDLVFSLDDDSHPEEVDCIEHITPIFDQRPQLAVMHFPQRSDEFPQTLYQTQFGAPRLTRSFANSGAVLRRSIYLQLPGFEPYFFHAYEEPDYALQCFSSDYEVCFYPVIKIRHYYSNQSRSELRTHQHHARNELWSALIRCPFPQVIGLVGYRIFSQFRYAWGRGINWAIREPVWWWRSLCGAKYCLLKRKPIAWLKYKAWLCLH